MTVKNHVVPFFSIIQSFEQSTMTFLCPTCGKTFLSKEKLRFHKQIHSEQILTCHICDEICIGTKKFSNHLKKHQTFECSNCNSTVKLNSQGSHMKTCLKQEGKRYSCPECPYVVDRQDRLKTHQFLHFLHHV